ncbi:MAG: hypothetical protein J5I90_10300 [Caldilineales bacterium]|nr:hypothetical protein [Caldilineales bacterium]
MNPDPNVATIPPAPAPTWSPEILQAFQSLAGRHSDDFQRLAMNLYDENHHYRGQLRDLRTQIEQLADRAAFVLGKVDSARRLDKCATAARSNRATIRKKVMNIASAKSARL